MRCTTVMTFRQEEFSAPPLNGIANTLKTLVPAGRWLCGRAQDCTVTRMRGTAD
jgi:hypothetical protein